MGQVASVIARSRAARAVAVIALASSAIVGVSAAPAAADIILPCNFSHGDTWITAYCNGSAPSAFRAFGVCTGSGGTHYGPWEFAGGTSSSTATCPTNTFLIYSQSGVQYHV